MANTVVVAGGGPTGLLVATELRLAGIDVVVIERALEPPKESRGLAFQARSLDVLNKRGLKARLGDDIPVFGRNHFALYWVDMESLGVPPMYVLPQWRVEEVLEERARELGADVRRGHEIIALAQDEDGASVTVRDGEGAEYELRGEFLVGADGGRSTVRKLAGFEFPGTGSGFYGILADVAEFEDDRERVEVGLFPGGVSGEVQLGPDRLRLMTTEFDVPAPDDSVPVTIEELKESIHRISGKDVKIAEPRWLSRFSDSTRQAAAYRQGRILLAGDAAHVFYPIGGQGLNTGLQDAFNLGWKLAAEIKGWAPEGLLDSYHDERHPVGAQVILNTRAQLALLHPLDKIGPLRELFGDLLKIPEVGRYLLNLVAGWGIRYPISYEGRDDAADLLGRPVPDAELKTAGGTTDVASTLHTGRGVLLDFSAGSADLAALTGFGDRIDVVAAEPVTEIAAAVVLLRPDGHIVWADPDGSDTEGLAAALLAWFGTPAEQ
ncbi:FAD-dependent monooxygenase [Actinocorallia sp. API 0066]|uniref:FAD-dependent monooxygenase n=1 Tax=Actinocorallia sp. API 0066 TaxID=2896846 RepID=UPI001E404269|nr:FAD-dependent monooxygenase [Actinocorallia sp. API 0066]MCD0451734.1 FAD-dependent monooxygenase [Actinocorallia sp. API 0066]